MEPTLSVVLQGYRRPILTRIILERLIEKLSGYDYELFIVTDSLNPEYVTILNDIAPEAYMLSSIHHLTRKRRGQLLNRAYQMLTGDYLMYVENDWYYVKDCIELGMKALNDGLDFIRFAQTPFNPGIDRGDYYEHHTTTGFQWNWNPGLAKDPFPAGTFPENVERIEGHYSDMFVEAGKRGGMLKDDYFTHIGVINARGSYIKPHERFFKGYSNALTFFKSLNPSTKHIELYEQYLKTEKRKR